MKLQVLVICLLLGGTLIAQNQSRTIDTKVVQWAEKYQLSAEQTEQAYTIQEREERNLAEIAVLEETDNLQFLRRRAGIKRHSEGSLRRILTPEQRTIQDEERLQQRLTNSDFIKQMRQEGKSKEEIELLLLERG